MIPVYLIYLEESFAGEDNDDDGFNVTESNIESSYEINLGLEDGSKIKQSFILGEGRGC